MSKKTTSQFVATIPGMDFKDIIQTAQAVGRPALKENEAEEAQTEEEDPQDTNPSDAGTLIQSSPPQTEPKGRKEGSHSLATTEKADYASLFFKPLPRARKGKTIVISDDLHGALASAYKAAPNGLSFSDYVSNMLMHHLQVNGSEIRRLLAEQVKRDNKNLYF